MKQSAVKNLKVEADKIQSSLESAMFFLTDTRKTDKEKIDFAIGALSNIVPIPEPDKETP